MSTVKVTNIQHGSATNVAMVLDSAGTVKAYSTIGVGNTTPATSGAGITFPATASASSNANTLDDYEEGTWTPSFSDAGAVTYTQQTGVYVKVGRLVTVQAVIQWSSFTAAGNLSLGGVPFTPSSEGNWLNTLAILGSNGTSYNQVYQYLTGGVFFFYTDASSPGPASTNPYGSSGYINISGTYFTST
jgi:hypothetical protein